MNRYRADQARRHADGHMHRRGMNPQMVQDNARSTGKKHMEQKDGVRKITDTGQPRRPHRAQPERRAGQQPGRQHGPAEPVGFRHRVGPHQHDDGAHDKQHWRQTLDVRLAHFEMFQGKTG